ncbi:anaerobic ribonucleoside-triphosphate reductase [Sphingobacterium humi]|uniref:Uncharacterized protein n=1 Tax=Sphingobacterium humi TaxID=1796905 RepID=A0A6N8KUG0_9SPHI|nr:anaerobic ribonucleoside-triphosphate reductase [Sphingobacterium humi]MVZ61100.1 hypothetical protein [Sphingobacterium humi]
MKTTSIEMEKILQEHEGERNKCLVYTRVMGYHRPVESFNIGKQGEHNQRKHFKEAHGKSNL